MTRFTWNPSLRTEGTGMLTHGARDPLKFVSAMIRHTGFCKYIPRPYHILAMNRSYGSVNIRKYK